jgi:hypothetical protein
VQGGATVLPLIWGIRALTPTAAARRGSLASAAAGLEPPYTRGEGAVEQALRSIWGLLWEPQIPSGIEEDWGENKLIFSLIPFNPERDLSFQTSPETVLDPPGTLAMSCTYKYK